MPPAGEIDNYSLIIAILPDSPDFFTSGEPTLVVFVNPGRVVRELGFGYSLIGRGGGGKTTKQGMAYWWAPLLSSGRFYNLLMGENIP